MVYQHFALFESVSVVENIALCGEQRLRSRRRCRDKISELSQRYGMPIDPHRRCTISRSASASASRSCAACCRTPKLLILDEPTSVLTPQAVVKLFETLRQLAAEGCSILYISHKLDEVQAALRHRDRAAQRQGDRHGKAQADDLARARPHDGRLAAARDACQPAAAAARSRCWKSAACRPAARTTTASISTTSRSRCIGGEIVGIAGVSGNGQAELVALLSGETAARSTRDAIRIAESAAGHLGPGPSAASSAWPSCRRSGSAAARCRSHTL